jgi:hypothetical protein
MSADRFIVEPEPGRRNSWRVVRVSQEGQRYPTPGRFRVERKAKASAYAMEVAAERNLFRQISLKD